MALDMNVELEGEVPDWKAIKDAAIKAGAHGIKENDEAGISFVFSRSNSPVWSWSASVPRSVVAEGNHGCHFLTTTTLIVRVNPSMYDESVNDIHDFLNHLSKLSPMQFVMSFQGEEVRAVRNKKGFEFFWNNPR